LYDCDPTSAAGLHRLVTTFPPDAPAWQDFGVDADEFRRELQALVPFDASEGFRAFYRLYAKQQGKPRYGDKTPIYCEHVALIERVLPEAHFVHIIRDGRDASLSLRRMWFAPAQDMAALARYWRTMVRAARDAGRRAAAYLEVGYEELVLNPKPVLEAICAFVDLRFDEAMLRHWERAPVRLREHRTRRRADGTVLVTHEQRLMQQRFTMQPPDPERLFRWRIEMTAQERAEFLSAAGDTLDELGYPV
jgi:Sulfotransferase family